MSLLDKLRKKDAPQKADKPAKKVSGTTKAGKKAANKKDTKKAAKAAKKEAKAPATKAASLDAAPQTTIDTVLVRPVVTEKATLGGTYIFEIAPTANKQEVKKAIQKMYGVTPKKVGIMNVSGKKTRWGQRQGKRKDWKKAVVRLNDGDKINVYEGI